MGTRHELRSLSTSIMRSCLIRLASAGGLHSNLMDLRSTGTGVPKAALTKRIPAYQPPSSDEECPTVDQEQPPKSGALPLAEHPYRLLPKAALTTRIPAYQPPSSDEECPTVDQEQPPRAAPLFQALSPLEPAPPQSSTTKAKVLPSWMVGLVPDHLVPVE